MGSRSVITALIFIFCLLLFTGKASAEDKTLLPQEESRKSFYEASLDSEDVRLFFSGSWKISLSASGGFGWSPASGFSTDLYYPGISEGFSFSQAPDLTISLLILDHFFFDSSFTDDFGDSTFRLGYIGSENDFVRSVSAGNMDISLSDRTRESDYFSVPEGGPASFGIRSLFAGAFSEHELLFRVDPYEELEKIYIGEDLVTETEKEVSEYLKGRLFILPDTPAEITLYTETDSPADIVYDDRNFTLLETSEYSYSPGDGRVFLEQKPDGAVLAVTSGSTITTLYDPGLFSGFESAAAYSLDTTLPSDSWRTRVFLAENAESTASGTEIKKEIMEDNGIVILEQAAGGSKLYPLSGLINRPDKIYGAAAEPVPDITDKKLIFRIRESSSGYSLDDPVEGSIRITVNGIDNYAWTVSGGVISFTNPPGDEDRIVIKYRKKNGGNVSDLLFASANRFVLNDYFTADLNAGARWNLTEGYSIPGEETSSYAGTSAGIVFSNQSGGAAEGPLKLSASLSAGAKIYTQNSAGNLLLKNMSGSAYEVALNRYNVFPASLSEKLEEDEGLRAADRGILLYKDYRVSSGLSNFFLQDYTTPDLSDDMVFSPVDSVAGSRLKAGPYTAAAYSDDKTGEVLIMDYILPENNSWTGVQIPLAPGDEYPDLSGSAAFTFDCKAEGDLSDIRIFVEIGSISEDLDGDGILDAETSEYSTGYIFNDPNSEAGTIIGGDNLTGENGRKDTEDFNGNGFLDTEKAEDSIVFQELETNPVEDWMRYRIALTESPGDTARRRLKSAGFIRISAVNSAGDPRSGRILFDNFRFEGTSMTASDEDGYSVPMYSETYETMLSAAETPSEALDSPTLDAGSLNSVMRIKWVSGDWNLYSYTSAEDTESYESIVFNYFCPAVSAPGPEPALLNFSLTDSSGKGIKAAVPLAAVPEWQKVEIRHDAVYINGKLSEDSSLSIVPDTGRLGRIDLYTSGTSAGTILIDEIYLADPRLQLQAGLNGDFDLEYSDNILEAGGIEIIGPLKFSQSAAASFDAPTSDLEENGLDAVTENGGITLASSLETAVLASPLSVDLILKNTAPVSVSAGHSLKIPLKPIGLSVTDSFFTEDISEDDFSKSNTLVLSTPIVSGTVAGFTATADSNQFLRKWVSDLNVTFSLFNLGLDAVFLLSDLDHDFSADNYFAKWYEAVSLAFTEDYEIFDNRSIELAVSPALTTQPIGLNADLGFKTVLTADGTAEDSVETLIGLPFIFSSGSGKVSAELTYSRRGVFSLGSDSESFFSDLGGMFELLGRRTYLYDSIPYYEMFDGTLQQSIYADCEAAGIDEAEIENTAGLSISRNYTSSLLDLILPYSLELSLGRTITKDFSTLDDVQELVLKWRSAALNLFGSAGAYPLFDAYFSDEFNWTVEATFTDPFKPVSGAELLVKTGCSIFGFAEDILSVDGTMYVPFNIDTTAYSTAEIMYVWNLYPELKADLPFFNEEDEKLQMIVNDERFTLNFEETFSSEVRHSTSFVLPGRFTLSAFVLAGFEFDTSSENSAALFGFSFGLSGSVIY